MFRFDAKTGFYFYPEAGDSEGQKLRINQGSTYEKNVTTGMIYLLASSA